MVLQYSQRRLQSLQKLCAQNDYSILSVLGIDGKHNKEASILAKYILFGSTGSDLLNGDIDTAFECLEESIVLIQRQSISIIWTAEAKKKFGNYLLALCPLLIEYNFSTEEEADVDLFQLRKCHHFKRMMLEAVPAKGAIAIPVPSSYELVSEVESWPVIQSFAISVNNDADGNLSPFSTGFFSSFFQIIDCTASVHTLYASLDGYVLENALNSVWGTAATQYKEIGSLLDDFLQGDGSTSDIEDISATLDLLFELGELQSAFPVESDLQPILLLGCETAALGDSDALVDVMSLRKEHAHEGNNDLKAVEHCIIEASEPSCGVRWCRSYFFSSTAMKRERELYQKLCLGLRRTMLNLLNAVTSSACKDNRDISEYISSGLFLLASQLNLGGNEELKVFSELRDAYGRRVVEEKSSEETLSSCWIYARLSVRDDSQQKNEESSNAWAIAVGDTFLLPPLTSSPPPSTLQTKALIADRVCLTSVFPYSFCLVRRTKHEPSENVSLAALLSSSSYESYHPSVVLLVDDPLSPLHFTNLRSFSEGFLIEKVDGINLSKSNQVVLSFEKHVAYAVLVDSEDLLSFASYALKIPLTSSIAAPLVPGGFFLFLSLKSDAQPLSSSSSELASLNSFGLQISSDSSSLADAWRRHWNKALIEFNIPVFRKADWDNCAMSEGMGAACVALLQSQFYQLEVSGAGKVMSKAYLPEMTKAVSSPLPHVGSNTAEETFLLDSCQLLRFSFDGSLPPLSVNKFEERDSLLRLVVVLGSAGSGVRTIVDQLHSRLASILSEEGVDEAEGLVNLESVELDLTHTDFSLEAVAALFSKQNKHSKLGLLCVVTSPLRRTCSSSLLTSLSTKYAVLHVLSVIPSTLLLSYMGTSPLSKASDFSSSFTQAQIGAELVPAMIVEALLGCDTAVVIDDDHTSGKGFSFVRSLLREIKQNAHYACIKITTTMTWLDGELLASILRLYRTPLSGPRPNQLSLQLDAGNGPHPSGLRAPPMNLRCLRCFTHTNKDAFFSIAKLTAALQRFFPRAVLSVGSDLIEADWRPPLPSPKVTGLKRIIALAKAKVAAVFEKQENERAFIVHLKSFDTLFTAVKGRVVSVHGAFALHTNIRELTRVSVEANPGSILLRSLQHSSPFSKDFHGALTVHGIISPREIDDLTCLFKLCCINRLSRKQACGVEDLTQVELELVQKKFKALDLPKDWAFDGSNYVNYRGDSKHFRPDILELAKDFVKKRNADAVFFNQLRDEYYEN